LSSKNQLGKGLKSLLGGVETNWDDHETSPRGSGRPERPGLTDETVLKVDPAIIDPNPDQPRKTFLQSDLSDLANSIRVDGVLQPLTVMESSHAKGRYTLIAGERRLRASRLAGLSKVPVIVRNVSREERLRLALIENIQRADLNIVEEARAYDSLIREHSLTQEQCAEAVGKDRATVANALRLLSLPEVVLLDLEGGRLSMGHGRALASLDKTPQILQARNLILKKELNVRKAEQLCRSLKKAPEARGGGVADSEIDPDMEYIAENLRTYLRTKVKISGASQRGKIEISYFSVAELERVLGLINKKL